MNLRSYLDEQKITPAAFAAAIGVMPASIYRYLSGERLPHREVMEKIAAETGGKVQPNDFFLASPTAEPQDAA